MASAPPLGLEAPPSDYHRQLRPTAAGWPWRPHWCVWLEPAHTPEPAGIWDQRWRRAIQRALTTWGQHLAITPVADPQQAQVLIERRRPPLVNNRASHGRSLLQLLEVQRAGSWQLEPRVQVLISPGQGPAALEATALHELGHAFGLWGHSDQPGDVMAAKPGAIPVVKLSARDRASLAWLQRQPALGQGLTPAVERHGAGPAPAAPGAN